MTPSPKNGHVRPTFFSAFSPKILFFSKKLLYEKIFRTSFPIKHGTFIFVVRRLLSFKRDFGPKNGFWAFSKKLLYEKIFKTSFPIKKVIFIFVTRCLLSFKRDLALVMFFWRFLRKLYIFCKKLLNNKIFNTSFVIKKKLC